MMEAMHGIKKIKARARQQKMHVLLGLPLLSAHTALLWVLCIVRSLQMTLCQIRGNAGPLGTSGIVLSCCPQHHLFYLQRKDLDDEEDGLPFASRPKVVAAKAARSAVSQPMQITTGATTSYNEVLDDDTDMEEDDTVPQIKLAGTALITLSA